MIRQLFTPDTWWLDDHLPQVEQATMWGKVVLYALLGSLAVSGSPSGILVYGPPESGVGSLARTVPALLVCGFVPGWVLARALRVDGFWLSVACAVLFSAFLAAVTAVPGLAGGGSFATSGIFLGVALWTLAIVTLARGLRRMPGAPRSGVDVPSFERPWSTFAVVAFVSLIAAVHAQNQGLAWRSDGWFHGVVTARLADAGLPLGDPYFAGQALHYPYFWHVLVGTTASVGARLGVSVFDALAGWSVMSALGMAAALVALAQAWGRRAGLDAVARDRAGAFAVAAAVVVVNPFGWILWLGRGLLGSDGGVAVLLRPLTLGAAETLGALSFMAPHVSLASTLDKFLTPTAFGLAQAAFLVVAAFLVGPRPVRFVLGAFVVAIGSLIHTILPVVFVIGVGAASLARAGAREGGRAFGRGAGPVFAAIALGIAVCWPYLLQATARGAGGMRFGGHADMVLAVVLLGALVAPLAWSEARPRTRRPGVLAFTAGWFALAATLLFLALAVTLVQRNETKFLNLALLVLAVPAGVALARLRVVPALGLCLLAAPTTLVAIAGFALDPGLETMGRRVPTPELAAAYAAVGRRTTQRDVLLEAQAADAHDPDRDLLLHGPRMLVWGGDGYASNWGYPATDLALRRRAALELAAGALEPTTVDDLRRRAAAIGGQVFAVRRDPDAAALGAPWTRVFANRALALEELDAPMATPRARPVSVPAVVAAQPPRVVRVGAPDGEPR